MTGIHFADGGIDQIIISLQASSDIPDILILSTAAFLVRSKFTWSWIFVPSTYMVLLRASWACEQHISVIFPHSSWMESQASLAVPPVMTPRLVTSVQLSVRCPLASRSLKIHSLRVGVEE